MKKTIALFAITILFLSAVVLAFEDYGAATKVQLDTMTKKSSDSPCGQMELAGIERTNVQFRLNNNLYHISRPESFLNKATFTMFEKEDCAIKVLLAEPTQWGSQVALSVMPISKNKIYFSGETYKLRKGEIAKEVLNSKFECMGAARSSMNIKVDAKPYSIPLGQKIKVGTLDITALSTQVGAAKYGNSLCVINIAKSLDTLSSSETPSTGTPAQGYAQGYLKTNSLFGGKITGKVTYSPEELARLEGKLTSTNQDKMDADLEQSRELVGGRFDGSDISGKVVYQVDTTKRGIADKTNAKRLSTTKKLNPTIKSTKVVSNPVGAKFGGDVTNAKVVYQPEKVVAAYQPRLQSNPVAKPVTNTGLTKKITPTVVAKPKVVTQNAVGGKFGGKITGKAVDESTPAVEKGFFAKLLSSIFGI